MARFLFPLLLLAAGTLVVALVRDRREREQRRLSTLRGSFLHGSPLGGLAPARGLVAVVAPGDALRLRLPSTWSGGFEGSSSSASFNCGSGRGFRLDLRTPDPEPASPEALRDSLSALKPEAERSLESLPSGNLLLKYLEVSGPNPAQVVFYWHLARLLPSRRALTAVCAFSVPVEQAGEVFVQADLTVLDREIRAASLGTDGSPSPFA